jgi:hypothetical protein
MAFVVRPIDFVRMLGAAGGMSRLAKDSQAIILGCD